MSRHDSNANRFQLEPLEDRLLFSGDSLYVVPIGDSVTYGSAALYQAGYRGPLEDLFQSAGQGHVFTGTLDEIMARPYSGVENRGHFAIPGTESGEILTALQDNYGSGTPTFDILRAQGTSPDFVLLHSGTNNLDPGLTTDDVTAADDLDDLLAYLNGPEGIDAGTQILLARITPRGTYSSTWGASDRAMLKNVAEYNYIQLPLLDAAYSNSVVPVDMFRIDATTLTTLTPQEMALVNTDGDVYVDWIMNYDESDPLNQSNIDGTTGRNSALFNDAEHPSALGYKIMAEVWSKALIAATGPLPDPGTVGDPISVGDVGLGLFGHDSGTGSGYIMYSQQNIHERFNHPGLSTSSHAQNMAQNLLVVKLIDGIWHIDGNGQYQAFTPEATDVLLASVDYDNDTVSSLQGTDSIVAGIRTGYAQGDLAFFADQWNGGHNNGEFQVTGTYFQLIEDADPDPDPEPDPDPDPTPSDAISVGDVKAGLQAYDSATGSGYIMYTQQDIHARFDHPNLSYANFTPDLAENLIVVKLINGVWHMDGNDGNYQAFTPVESDVLIASLDFDNDTVSSLQGVNGTLGGIRMGYEQGDLAFFADQFNGGHNNGDFQVTGTHFQLSDTDPDPEPDPDPDPTPSDAISVGDVGLGLFGHDSGTGSGYIMYSQQNIHERFNHPGLSTSSHAQNMAQNLLVVKLIDGVWHIDGNGQYQAFTPEATDVLLASVDYDNDTVTSLQGVDGSFAGIDMGYAQGDLAFFADQWNGGHNNGEFQVTGTSFTPNA